MLLLRRRRTVPCFPRPAARAVGAVVLIALAGSQSAAADPEHPVLTWVKRHPRDGASKPSPRMGYETSYGYDFASGLLLRYGGHNQGGGGEQNSELWTYDLDRDVWTLRQPNDAPPGVCCAQANAFDPAARRFVRFPAFSASHGWQSRREVWLKDTSVWTYDPVGDRWRNRRPMPEPLVRPLRGAAYDPHHGVVVVHGGEGASHGTVLYDPWTNTWHRMRPDPAPEASLSQPGFAYDPVHRLFVLFGSQFGNDPATWAYDLRRNRWRILETADHPPADKTSPVLAADSRSGVVLAVVDAPSGNETWVLDPEKPEWRRLPLEEGPEKSGARNRVLLYLPDRNLFVLENRTREEQAIWTFRYREAPPPAAALRDATVDTFRNTAILQWNAPATLEPETEFDIYRGRGARPWECTFEKIATVSEALYTDEGLEPGAVYQYRIVPRGAPLEALEPWPPLRTQPPIVEDVVVSVISPREVLVRWRPTKPARPTRPAFKFSINFPVYHVERAAVRVASMDEVKPLKERYREAHALAPARIIEIGPFIRLTRKGTAIYRYADTDLDLEAPAPQEAPGREEPLWERPLPAEDRNPGGKPYPLAVYAYRIIAVNGHGVESGPSPARFTYPAPVQDVFARELDRGRLELKWSPSEEEGLLGYHVYRHDGRWLKDPVVRLTDEPITACSFIDETAGEGTRRYEVVAVDGLGQEGVPSRPVWSRREWGKFYVPYIGEWHQ